MAGLEKEFINEWHRAPAYTPDGLLLGNDPSLLTDIIDYNEPQSIPSPWSGLNHAIYGFRLSEFTLFLADTGVGKTTFMKEIEYKLLMDEEVKKYGYGIGFLHLEEPKRDTALGLMSIHRNKTYHLPDTVRSRDELIEAYNEVINTPRVVIYDHFGANDIDVIVSKVRHMAAMGCRYIVLDHLSIIVSDHSQDERKGLDEISTKLKTLCMNLDICLICVVHVNRNGEVRGSAGPEKVANNMVRLIRDKKDPDEWRRNVTQIMVEKCRLSGRSGPAGYVWYDPDTGRLVELSKELSEAYERGDSVAGKEFEAYGS
jgi:twinkle protein